MMFVYFLIVGTRMSATKRKEMSKKNKIKRAQESTHPGRASFLTSKRQTAIHFEVTSS